jgi:spore germination protein YaaH
MQLDNMKKLIVPIIGIIIIGIIVLIVVISLVPQHKEVQGFYPLDANQTSWHNVRFDLLSTLVLYFIYPNADGDIDINDSDVQTSLVNIAHSNDVKVVISIQPKDNLTTDALLTTSKDKFLDNILYFIKRNNLDGVDIDIEKIDDINSITGEDNKQLMTNFMRELSVKLWNSNPKYRISIDINGDHNSNIFDVASIQNYVNYLMIMGYDYHWAGGDTAGSVSPINAYDDGASIKGNVDYYSSIVNKNKLLLGVPYYGLEWHTENGDIESPTLSQGTYYTYKEMKDRANKYGRLWDNTWKTPWYRYQIGDAWYQGHYDDVQSLAIKYDLVNSVGIAGIGIWEIEYGSNESELWQLMQDKFGERKK